MTITGNEPVTNVALDENEINNGNETVDIPHPPINHVDFNMSHVQVPVSHSDEEDYFIVASQEIQPDPDPNDHDLPAIPVVNYSGEVNVPANEVNGWERLSVDTEPKLNHFCQLHVFLLILHLVNQKYTPTVSLMKECSLLLQNRAISMKV